MERSRSHLVFICHVFFVILALGLSSLHGTHETPHHKIRVALFLDHGAHPRNNLRLALEASPDISVETIDGGEIRQGYLTDFDLLIVPGGSAKKQSVSMKAEGRDEVRRFVQQGGFYIGICAGAYLLTQAKDSDLGLLPLDTMDKPHWRRGKGTLPIELTSRGREIFGTTETHINVLYHNGPVIDASHVTANSGFEVLGYFRGELVNKHGKAGIMVNTPAMFLGRFGNGWVLGISPHPEANSNQVNMVLNAIRWLYAHRKA